MNFVDAQKDLVIYTKGIKAKLADKSINWRFTSSSYPHFGGL